MRRVHFDVGVAQFVGEVNSEGVECGLGGVVGEGLCVVDRRLGIGLQRERAENTGKIYDAAGWALLDERQERLGKRYLREKVGLEDFFEQVQRDVACGVLGTCAREGASGDAGIVDEDVEAAILRVEVIV